MPALHLGDKEEKSHLKSVNLLRCVSLYFQDLGIYKEFEKVVFHAKSGLYGIMQSKDPRFFWCHCIAVSAGLEPGEGLQWRLDWPVGATCRHLC